MTEKVAVFGEKKSLIGIISEPDSVVEASDTPAVILLNSGLLHRVGPNRLYVKIARALASAGFVAMRFDLSGIGDSPRVHNLPQEESAKKDIEQAMSHLAKTFGTRSFILMGICSGADNAFQVACHDPRVAGVVMIDGFAFVSAGFLLNAYFKQLLSLRSWQRLFNGESEIWEFIKSRFMSRGSDESDEIDPVWPEPDIEQVRAGAYALAERGADLFYICAAEGVSHYNYKKTYAKIFTPLARSNKLRLEVFKETDHLFSPLHIQKSLVEAIRKWATHITAGESAAIESAK